MSRAKLDSLGSGRFRVSGVLDAVGVVHVLKESRERFKGAPQVEVDLAGVTESDSSGLALLLEWLRQGGLNQQTLRFTNLPPQISALARISEVDDLLAANGEAQGSDAVAGHQGRQAH